MAKNISNSPSFVDRENSRLELCNEKLTFIIPEVVVVVVVVLPRMFSSWHAYFSKLQGLANAGKAHSVEGVPKLWPNQCQFPFLPWNMILALGLLWITMVPSDKIDLLKSWCVVLSEHPNVEQREGEGGGLGYNFQVINHSTARVGLANQIMGLIQPS